MTISFPPIIRTYRVYIAIRWGADNEYVRRESATIDAVDAEAACYIMRDRYALFIEDYSKVSCRADELPKAAW